MNNKVDEYINTFPDRARVGLVAIRTAIRSEAPDAVETIKYRMPTYVLGGNLVHFAGYATHIGFYPTPSAITVFEKQLTKYKTSKGAIQFPIDAALPLDLIRRIVRFRVEENMR